MEMWISKKKCTGCGACSNVCPKDAITMIEDEYGFKYPVIYQEKCINCELCKKTCPIIKLFDTEHRDAPDVYAAWSKDENKRFNSTSGGAFAEIATVILKNGGSVIGAKYNSSNMVEHAVANNEEELKKLMQSKYVQSDTKQIYKEAKKILDSGKIVSFCGTPCQIGGLYKYLKKDYDNLLTIEFICRGVNSPKAYKYWLKEISENNDNKKIKRVWFKYKENGWKKSPRCTRIDFEDGTYKIYSFDDNLFMTGYLGPNLYIRPSCGNCNFKELPRQADLTLADFWKVNKELDDDKGTSLVLINSRKGEIWLKKVKNLNLYKKEPDDFVAGNGSILLGSVKINPKSKRFLKGLNEHSFSYQLKKYDKELLYKKAYHYVKEKIRRVIKKEKKNES